MLHQLISAYIIFGGMFTTNPTLLRLHIVNNIIVVVHWWTNNNRCFLSADHDDDSGYSQDMVMKLTGVRVSSATANAISYASVILPAMFSAWKLMLSHQNAA
jgi:hypothetical protein